MMPRSLTSFRPNIDNFLSKKVAKIISQVKSIRMRWKVNVIPKIKKMSTGTAFLLENHTLPLLDVVNNF